MRQTDYTLVYILGSGHCGSTLLDLLLNGHPAVCGLGEVMTISRSKILKKTLADESTADFWKGLVSRYEAETGSAFSQLGFMTPSLVQLLRWGSAECRHYERQTIDLLNCLQDTTGAAVFVDASKFWNRLYVLQQCPRIDLKVLHLVRDGRAVVNSYLERYPDFFYSVRRWAGPNLMSFYLKRKSSPQNWLQVYYEDLALHTEKTLRTVCTFLNIAFEPGMLAYRKHPYYGVGGNRMRNNSDERIFLEEKWKQNMSGRHRRLFAVCMGWLNRYYGYRERAE